MTQSETTTKTQTPVGSWLEILGFIIQGHQRRFVLCIFLGMVSNGFVAAANPLALKFLFDEGIIRGDFARFAWISVGFVAIFTVWRIGVYLYRIYTQRLKNDVFSGLSQGMLETFFRIPFQEVTTRDRGYFLSRIYDEVASTAPLVMETTFMLFNMAITLVAALVVALSISVRASLMVLVAVPVVYLLSQRYGKRIKRESIAEQEEEARVRGVLEQTVGAYKTARLFALEGQAKQTYTSQVSAYIDAFFARFTSSARYEMLSGVFMSYVENIVIVSAGYEILMGRMSFGGFMGFMSAFWAVMGAVRGIFGMVPDLSRASGMVARLREFEELDTELSRVRHADSVALRGVTFGFENQTLFDHFDFTPDSGERILVVGPNGSGKSTLAHLLCGLLQPEDGQVETHPMEQISAAILPFEFVPGTARDNLAFVDLDGGRVESLARRLGVEASLNKNPSELSAGQRKRLEILMVLAKPAAFYMIDEPLAGIDVESKDEIIKAIFEETVGKTLMVVMHGDERFHSHFDRTLRLDEPSTPRDTTPTTPEGATRLELLATAETA